MKNIKIFKEEINMGERERERKYSNLSTKERWNYTYIVLSKNQKEVKGYLINLTSLGGAVQC